MYCMFTTVSTVHVHYAYHYIPSGNVTHVTCACLRRFPCMFVETSNTHECSVHVTCMLN